MRYSITHGPVFTALTINLDPGETVRAEAGAMVAMTRTIELQATGSGKGIFGSLKAAIGGESLFASLYTATGGPGELLLAPGAPGEIITFELQGKTIFAQGGAFLAGEQGIQISTQGSLKGLISGEGLFLQKISGTGRVFLTSYGAVIERVLSPGETFIVDTGHLVAFEDGVRYSIHKAARGIISSVVSGEGLACHYEGPGRIWIQTRNLSAFANQMMPFMVKR
jgi:uncharacterized protein (TIGR00266 family)